MRTNFTLLDNTVTSSYIYVTGPEVSEGGPPITNLTQGVPSEETERHRQIKVSISITRMDLPLRPN